MRSGLALTLLMFVVGSLFNLIVNLNADPATYPFGWELLPGSFKAGTVEEIGYRFFVVSLFVWIEKLFIHENDSRPKDRVYWMAILVASLCLVGRITMPDWEILPRLLEITHWLWH